MSRCCHSHELSYSHVLCRAISQVFVGDVGHNDYGCCLWLLDFFRRDGWSLAVLAFFEHVCVMDSNMVTRLMTSNFLRPGLAGCSGARPQEVVVLLPLETGPILFRVNAALH